MIYFIDIGPSVRRRPRLLLLVFPFSRAYVEAKTLRIEPSEGAVVLAASAGDVGRAIDYARLS